MSAEQAQQIAFLYAEGVFALVCGLVLLTMGVGTYWFARMMREVITARSHRDEAEEATDVRQQAHVAMENIQFRRPPQRETLTPQWAPPSEEELLNIVRNQGRNGRVPHDEDDHEYTTEGNEGIPEVSPGWGGGVYRNEPADN